MQSPQVRYVLPIGLGLATVAYLPGVLSVSTLGRWLVLALAASAGLMLVSSGRRGKPVLGTGHWLALLFLAYVAVSMSWSVSPLDTAGALVQYAILAGLFLISSLGRDHLRAATTAISAGLLISLLIAVVQLLGHDLPIRATDVPAGLFLSRNALGEISAVVLVLAVCQRNWIAAPVPLALVAISGSRGALFAVAVATLYLLWQVAPWRLALPLTLSAVLAGWFALALDALDGTRYASMMLRLEIWDVTAVNVTPLGFGAGTFAAALPFYEHAHNEPLQLMFELGSGFLILAGVFWYAILQRRELSSRVALVAWIAASVVSFPLHHPLGAALVAVILGSLCGAHDRERRAVVVLGDAAGRHAWRYRAVAAGTIRAPTRG
jgi:hypothetical protein